MSCPDQIYAGDTLEFGVNVDDRFKPALGWGFTQVMAPQFSTPVQAVISIAGTANGTVNGEQFDFVITATPAVTAVYKPGAYSWWRYVSQTGARVTLNDLDSRGQLVILQDPATAVQGFDNRTQAQKRVSDLKTAYASFTASNGAVTLYRIGDREVRYGTRSEILQDLSYWESQLAIEEAAEQIAAGLKNPRGIYVRMDRA